MAIIKKYIQKEILLATVTTTVTLVAIILINQILLLLTKINAGIMAKSLIWSLILLNIPIILTAILPFSFFLALLLSLSRLHSENEMAIIQGAGIGDRKLIQILFPAILLVMSFSAVINLWLSPLSYQKREHLYTHISAADRASLLVPGQFFSLENGRIIAYADSISTNKPGFTQIFLAELPKLANLETGETGNWNVILSSAGKITKYDHEDYLELQNGHHYQGRPGSGDFKILNFSTYSIHLNPSDDSNFVRNYKSAPTSELLNSPKPAHLAILHWRLAFILAPFFLALLAIPLSYTRPRQSRFLKILPGLFFVILYYNLLSSGKNFLDNQILPSYFGLWWVHGIMLLIFISFYSKKIFRKFL